MDNKMIDLLKDSNEFIEAGNAHRAQRNISQVIAHLEGMGAEPVYCVATDKISEDGKHVLYSHHDAPVPMADNFVLYATPPAQAARMPEGWKAEPIMLDGVCGYRIATPRIDGVRTNTCFFEDSESLEEQMLYLMLNTAPAAPGDGEHVCECGSKGWTANCEKCVPY